jgi:hypothetical protein
MGCCASCGACTMCPNFREEFNIHVCTHTCTFTFACAGNPLLGRPYLLWRLLICGRVLRSGLHRSLCVGRICRLLVGLLLRVRLILRRSLCKLLILWLWLIRHGLRLVLRLWGSLLQLRCLSWLCNGTLAVEAVLLGKLTILRFSQKTR